MRNCYICEVLTPNYFDAKTEYTNFTGKPVIEVFSLINGPLTPSFDIICSVCLQKCNEYDEHISKAEQIQKDFNFLLQKKTLIKQEPREYNFDDNFAFNPVTPHFSDFPNIKMENFHFNNFSESNEFPSLENESDNDIPLVPTTSLSPPKVKKPKTHKKREKFSELLNCPEPGCERRFDNRAKLMFHVQYHSKERPHQCQQCGKTFKTKSCLSSHGRTVHKEKRVICDACGMDFSRKPSLLRHFLAAHFKLRPYVCATCGLAYNNSSSLKSHQFTHDQDNKNFVCPVCAARFYNKYKLTRHMRSHGEKEYECTICHRMLSQRYNLNAHMKAVHGIGADQLKPTQRNIVCQLCGKTFDKQKTLQTHLMNVHDAVPVHEAIPIENVNFTTTKY